MDFDYTYLQEFRDHFEDLGILQSWDDFGLHELIRRTTKDTRGGDAFSFKPTHMWIGSSTPRGFYSGFECVVDPEGPNLQKLGTTDRSSFWLRFNTAGEVSLNNISVQTMFNPPPSEIPLQGLLSRTEYPFPLSLRRCPAIPRRGTWWGGTRS